MTLVLNDLSEDPVALDFNAAAVLGPAAVLAPSGIAIDGDGSNTLTNRGTIAPVGFVAGVSFDGASNWILNEGVISAELTAVSLSPRFDPGDDTSNRVVNAGTITSFFGTAVLAAGAGFTLVNSGEIFGASGGVLISTAPGGGPIAPVINAITNHGRIASESVVTLSFGVGNTRLTNTGEIVGSVSLATPEAQGEAPDGLDDLVENSGSIFGEIRMGDRADRYVGHGEAVVTEGVYGGRGADTLTGSAAADLLFGDNGRDLLEGRGDADRLEGGDGVDTLRGGGGDDALDGGAKGDLLSGGAGEDTLRGGRGSDTLMAGAGDDLLVGGRGADVLQGGRGADSLDGWRGRDTLAGDAGDDVLTGGAGADTFVMAPGGGRDVVTDFLQGEDRLELRAFGFADFTDFQARASLRDAGGDLEIGLGTGDSLLLEGVAPEDLGAGDFLF